MDYDPWAESQTHKADTRKMLPHFELRSDTSGQVVQVVEKMIGDKKYSFTPIEGNPFSKDKK